jgi:hypothetical protein
MTVVISRLKSNAGINLKKKLNNEIAKSNRQIAETEAKSIPQKHKFMTCNPVYALWFYCYLNF